MSVRDRRRRGEPVGPDAKGLPDRREFERVLVNIEVDYRCDETFLFAYITDLSEMGIFIQTERPHPPGTQLNLRFAPRGGPQIDVEGRVMWINAPRAAGQSLNPGMGVQFVDLTPGQREQVMALVRTFAYLSDDDTDQIIGNS